MMEFSGAILLQNRVYTFDHVFRPAATQEEVYMLSAKPIVKGTCTVGQFLNLHTQYDRGIVYIVQYKSSFTVIGIYRKILMLKLYFSTAILFSFLCKRLAFVKLL